MLFSIIIPTFNSASTIGSCIESIINQSIDDFEILILDGLSSDSTLEIITQYKDVRIKVFSEKDYGVYDAMNKGIDKAKGDWLYFLGSDDHLYNNDILLQIKNSIEENICDFIYGNAFFIGEQYFYDGEFDRIKLFQEKNICHQAIFYHKNLFKRLGKYNLDFFLYADWDFNIRCFSTPDIRIKYVDIPIAYYNDMSGLSFQKVDSTFLSVSGVEFVQQARYMKDYYRLQLNTHIENIKNSMDFKLGNFLLSPFRFVINLLKK